MRHRRRMQAHILGPDPVNVGEIDQRHRRQVPVGQHRPLGAPGGAGGVEYPSWILRPAFDL